MVYAASNISYFYFPWEYFLKTQKKRGIKTLDIYGSMPHFWIDEYSYNDSKLIEKVLFRIIEIVLNLQKQQGSKMFVCLFQRHTQIYRAKS